MTDEQRYIADGLDLAVRYYGLNGIDKIIRIFSSHIETSYSIIDAVEEYLAANNEEHKS